MYCFHKWKCRRVTVFVKEHIFPLLEERDFLFQIIPLPKGKPVKFLYGHSKDILKFLRWQVPLEREVQWSTFVPNRTVQQGQIMNKNNVYLQSCPVYTRWEFVSASVGHNEHLIWVNLPNEHIVSNKHTINELWPRASSHLCTRALMNTKHSWLVGRWHGYITFCSSILGSEFPLSILLLWASPFYKREKTTVRPHIITTTVICAIITKIWL